MMMLNLVADPLSGAPEPFLFEEMNGDSGDEIGGACTRCPCSWRRIIRVPHAQGAISVSVRRFGGSVYVDAGDEGRSRQELDCDMPLWDAVRLK